MARSVRIPFFRPGVYRGVPYTPTDLRQYAENSNAAIAGGIAIPLIDRHARIGAGDAETEAAAGTDGRGWAKSFGFEDGWLWGEVEVTDPQAAEGIDNGSIKFVSPEFRPNYQSDDGRDFGKVIRHLALTPTPANQHQGPIQQLSEQDYEGPIMADENTTTETEETADTTTDESTGGLDATKMLTDAAAKLGLELPDGIDIKSDEGLCLFATAVINSGAGAVVEDATDDLPEEEPMQYSEDSEAFASLPAAVRQELIDGRKRREEAAQFAEQVAREKAETQRKQSLGKITSAKIPPGLKTKLMQAHGAQQFSESGGAKTYTPAEVAEMVAKAMPEAMQFAEGAKEVDQPDDTGSAAGLTDEQQKELLERHGRKVA